MSPSLDGVTKWGGTNEQKNVCNFVAIRVWLRNYTQNSSHAQTISRGLGVGVTSSALDWEGWWAEPELIRKEAFPSSAASNWNTCKYKTSCVVTHTHIHEQQHTYIEWQPVLNCSECLVSFMVQWGDLLVSNALWALLYVPSRGPNRAHCW